MKSSCRRIGALLLPLALAGCAAPLPSVVTPLPGTLGPGPDCGPQAYPFQSLQNFVRGQVLVRGIVGADGRLTHPAVEQPSWDPYLTAAAVEGVRHCRMPASPPGTIVRLVFLYEFYGQDEYLPRGVVSVLFAPPA
jgi:TonB family protein